MLMTGTAATNNQRIRLIHLLVMLVSVGLTAGLVSAQDQSAGATVTPTVTPGPANPAASGLQDDRYRTRIGLGDVLDIRVLNRPQLSRESVRVEGNGTIRMPMIDQDIRAACRTEAELSQVIAQLYLRYIRRPEVFVTTKEYQAQPTVAVIGAVRNPSQFKLQRRVRLLELLSLVGGPSDTAGRSIQIVHTATPTFCEDPETATPESEDDAKKISFYKLDETLNGVEEANPVMRPGDIVNVAPADQVYLVGNIVRPTSILLKEPITLTRAIAMAGGTLPDTKKDKIRIVRQFPGSTTKSEIIVDLKAVEKHQAEDPVLQPNDIVDIPTSEGKRIVRSLLGTIAPTVSQLPVRVIP